MENGVKNLKGARLFPKTSSNHGFGDASQEKKQMTQLFHLIIRSLRNEVNENSDYKSMKSLVPVEPELLDWIKLIL